MADKGVELFVHTADVIEARLDGFARGDFAFGELRSQLGNGELVEHFLTQRRKVAKVRSLHYFRHDEEAAGFGGGVAQGVFVGHGGAGFVGTRDVDERKGMRGGLDSGDVGLI